VSDDNDDDSSFVSCHSNWNAYVNFSEEKKIVITSTVYKEESRKIFQRRALSDLMTFSKFMPFLSSASCVYIPMVRHSG
jgi:hypothetical protein